MADLTPYIDHDPLVAAIDEALVNKAAKQPQRDYLGASVIGGSCSRKLWYMWRGHREVFDAQTLRRFEDGHDTEAKIVSWLRLIDGLELYAENDGEQYGFSDFNGKFKGHYDGVVRGLPQAPKTWHILEIKTVGEKNFKKVEKLLKEHPEKSVLEQWNARYYAQAVLYMYYEQITRHITIVATPGGRDLLTFRTQANNKFAKALRSKAQRIMEAIDPPERIGGPDWYECKWCAFRSMCHG